MVNPALLKLDLFCKGLRIDESCNLRNDARPILRTRAGLGSGLEIILPDGIYVNAPVEEKWTRNSPYILRKRNGRYFIEREGTEAVPVRLPPPPKFYSRKTSSGKEMRRIGVMQGTYLGIYPTRVCHYWTEKPRCNCHFCSVGLNVGVAEEESKSVEDVLETVLAARREEKITFVHFNTGYYEGDTYLDDLIPFIKAVKEKTGLLIGVQTPPHPDFSRYDDLRAMGVNNVSFCFEIWDRKIFEEVCPGKAAHVGQERYLRAIEYCARLFDTTNGEIIAGLEPPEKTIEAINWITSVGAIPTVCVFRPLTGTDYEDKPPPDTERMIPIFRRLYEACMERGLPIGIAPNIKVSIVMLPEEGRYLCGDTSRFRLTETKLRAKKLLFGAAFKLVTAMKRV